MFDIKGAVRDLLDGCIIVAKDGTKMFTPDGKGDYPALWTRDFSYMVEFAGDLISNEDIRRALQYTIDRPRSEGWIADRVKADGTPVYTAGGPDFPALSNLDNGCFLCISAKLYLDSIEYELAKATFLSWKDTLLRGIDCLPTNELGFIVNNTTPPHSPYGFTDTISKTGILCFETLLLWRAKRAIISLCEKFGLDSDNYAEDCKVIEHHFADTFIQPDGMPISATGVCRQTDVWAACYAVSIGFPLTDAQKNAIADWIIKNYDGVVSHGQLRHLPAGQYWEKTFIEVDNGTYQNGAFWATPFVWLYDTLSLKDASFAKKALDDILVYFETYGIYECVNGEDRKLDTYVASAAAVYHICKRENLV